MKKIYILILSFCLAITISTPISSVASSFPLAPTSEVGTEYSLPLNENERVVNILNKNNIDFQFEDGKLVLIQKDPVSIVKANSLLQSEYQNSATAFTSYPTPYQYMKAHDIYHSKKFKAATKTAFAAAFTAWAKNIATPWQEIVAVGVGGFAVYYFVNTETEDLHTFIKYYYRELGPGFFDHNGTFIGDYEIKKEIRVTNKSNGTGGNVGNDIRKSTIVEPWF